MRVLIVEDERDLGEIFQDYIVSRGHAAEVVSTAEAALDRLQTSRPDAIVLDVKLPGMSGLEFMRLPDVRAADVAVIVVSGHATEDQARACLRLGALEFLPKPVPLEVLGAVLQHAEVFAGADDGRRADERRATRRFPVSLPVRVVTETGQIASGRAIEASATGLRARIEPMVAAGSPVRVSIAMPDRRGLLEVIALVVRADADGVALWFLDLAPAEADRLLALAR